MIDGDMYDTLAVVALDSSGSRVRRHYDTSNKVVAVYHTFLFTPQSHCGLSPSLKNEEVNVVVTYQLPPTNSISRACVL